MDGAFLSIITPCYNHGRFLDEMLDSVHQFNWPFTIEHIIVDDGSDDSFTVNKLNTLGGGKHVAVIRQRNQGLAMSRNLAVSSANGKYILPLDADNKIFADVIVRAIDILEKSGNIDVVYTDAEYFGDRQGSWAVEDYQMAKLLYTNQFDACALIRRKLFTQFGGYDARMPAMGHEDWELWIRLGLNGCNFYHLGEIGFGYRVLNTSMVNTLSTPNWKENRRYIFLKHAQKIADWYDTIYNDFIKPGEKKGQGNLLTINEINHKIRSTAKSIFKRK